jgi:hypothetical protein
VRRDEGRPVQEPNWHDREPVALAAGVAAFALLGLLALAVIRTSHDATNPAPFVAPAVPSDTTTSPTIKILTTTSVYSLPSAQTSEDSGAPVTTSSTPPPVVPGDSEAPPIVPTTIFNPYATTTQGNAGHV